MFKKKGYTNIRVLKNVKTVSQKQLLLNTNIQKFFRELAGLSPVQSTENTRETFINYFDVPFVSRFFFELADEFTSKQLNQKLNYNMAVLEEVAAYFFRIFSRIHKNTPENLKINPYTFSLLKTKETLIADGALAGAIDTRDDISEQLKLFLIDIQKSLVVREPMEIS